MPYKTLKNKIDMWKIVTFTLNEKAVTELTPDVACVQNYWVTARLSQPFILPRSIK